MTSWFDLNNTLRRVGKRNIEGEKCAIIEAL
jgi:hypothetical protein